MADSTIPQNLIPNEPDLTDALKQMKKDIFLSLNAHHLCTIQSFDTDKQTASATINYKRTVFKPNAAGVYGPVLLDYPILIDCPVVCLGGGDGSLRFPISVGDEAIVLFNDRSIDNWYQGSATSGVSSPRMHSISDGIILVGVRSMGNVLTDYADDAAEFVFGTTKVRVEDGQITLTTDTGVVLVITDAGKLTITNASGEFVASLLDMLTTATTNTLLGPQPLVLDPALLTILETFKA